MPFIGANGLLPRRPRSGVVAGLAVLVLLLAACGEETDDAGTAEDGDDAEVETDDGTEDEATEEDGDGDATEDDSAEEGADDSVELSFYEEGDDLTVIVPFGEGGGTDTLARIAMPYLSEELGINIQVENIPGAGSIPGVNEFQNQRNSEDGYTMMFHSASSQIPALLDQAGVEYSFDGQDPLAGFPLGGVIYSADDGPIQDPTELAGPNQDEQITYGGQPPAGGELRILLLFEMFETDVNEVLGYDGRGPSRTAWEQGESDLSYDTAPAYLANVQPLVEQGDAVPLMTFGFVGDDGGIVADPQFPDIPSPGDVYEEAFGEPIQEAGEPFEAYRTMSLATLALNKSMIAHTDAPEEAKDDIRAGWERMLEDEDFLGEIENELGGYEILLGDELQTAWDQMTSVDVDSPEIQWMIDWAEESYDVDLQQVDD